QNNPVDLVTMPDGTVVWTADSGLGRRRPDGLVESASSAPAYAIALSAAGNVRFTATVTAFDNNTYGWVCRFASEQFGSNQDCAHGPGTTRLTGLALDSSGKLWAAAYEENDLRRLDAAGDNFDLELDLPA